METREHYQALMEKNLNEWKEQTERFRAGAEQIEAHAKSQYKKNLEDLRAKQSQAWENFYNLKNANERAWEQLKAHMDKAGADVMAALENMTRKFK
ncbi:MAG TPA: hypothetical protein VK820_03805 [Steroidobacteraceae bacterium]|jgi:hypothetical protein|nr:hypothetical protein [Steroidobacteraceae bacterium]